MKLLIANKAFLKNYLVNSSRYVYNSAFDFILELFTTHHFVDREAELYLYELLKDSGYSSIEQIPPQQLNVILDYFLENRDLYKVDYDEERLSYLLLAAIQAEKIVFTIDDKRITDLKEKIYLREDSTVNFFNLDKMDRFKFKII